MTSRDAPGLPEQLERDILAILALDGLPTPDAAPSPRPPRPAPPRTMPARFARPDPSTFPVLVRPRDAALALAAVLAVAVLGGGALLVMREPSGASREAGDARAAPADRTTASAAPNAPPTVVLVERGGLPAPARPPAPTGNAPAKVYAGPALTALASRATGSSRYRAATGRTELTAAPPVHAMATAADTPVAPPAILAAAPAYDGGSVKLADTPNVLPPPVDHGVVWDETSPPPASVNIRRDRLNSLDALRLLRRQ